MGNHLNKAYMEVEGNQTTRNTSIHGYTTGGTDRHFFLAVLGLWEANKTTKRNLSLIGENNRRKSLRHNMIRILRTYNSNSFKIIKN